LHGDLLFRVKLRSLVFADGKRLYPWCWHLCSRSPPRASVSSRRRRALGQARRGIPGVDSPGILHLQPLWPAVVSFRRKLGGRWRQSLAWVRRVTSVTRFSSGTVPRNGKHGNASRVGKSLRGVVVSSFDCTIVASPALSSDYGIGSLALPKGSSGAGRSVGEGCGLRKADGLDEPRRRPTIEALGPEMCRSFSRVNDGSRARRRGRRQFVVRKHSS
jgi:hypothetical protein